jgi:hypothetical protein
MKLLDVIIENSEIKTIVLPLLTLLFHKRVLISVRSLLKSS